MPGIGVSLRRRRSGLSWTHEIQDEYVAILAAISQAPSHKVQDAQNSFIYYLKGNNSDSRNVWAKIACLIPYAAGMPVAADALFWWNNPARKATLSAVEPVYIPGGGFCGNTVSAYVNTTFNTASDGGLIYTRDSASYINGYSNKRTVVGLNTSGNYASNNGVVINPIVTGNKIVCSLNSIAGSTLTAPTNLAKIITLTRPNSTTYKVYYDKVDAGTVTVASQALVNREVYDLVNHGATNVEFSTDVKSLTIFGSAFDETDIKVLNDAWYALMDAVHIAISNTLYTDFSDELDGVTLDLSKWDKANQDDTVVRISQNDAIILDVMKTDTVATYLRNSVVSKTQSYFGSFAFSAFCKTPLLATISYIKYGLIFSETNSIEFSGAATGQMTFKIIKNGTAVYTVNNVTEEFGQFKINISKDHDISAYIWTNDAWVQIGATYNCALGAKKIFIASNGQVRTRGSLKSTYMRKLDFSGVVPVTVTDGYIDVRDGGAVPDGTTDNSAAINSQLLTGNVIIKNGVFALSSAIEIPSNRTLYIKNAIIKVLDASYDGIARNKDILEGSSNVNIIGLGNAVLDGNSDGNNDADYSEYGIVDGDPSVATELYKAALIYIGNCNTFEIKNLNITDHVAYCGCVQKSFNGSIHDILVNHDFVTQNQDAFQMIWGTHDVEIYNIIGNTADDFVSIMNPRKLPSTLFYPLPDYSIGDVYNIDFHDLEIRSCIHALILIPGDGNKIYNVSYDDVNVASAVLFCYFGNPTYRTTGPAKEDFTLITMDNVLVTSQLNDEVITFNENCSHVAITNFTNNTGKPDYATVSGDQTDDVTINGVQVL